jgi:hypothetical protein
VLGARLRGRRQREWAREQQEACKQALQRGYELQERIRHTHRGGLTWQEVTDQLDKRPRPNRGRLNRIRFIRMRAQAGAFWARGFRSATSSPSLPIFLITVNPASPPPRAA